MKKLFGGICTALVTPFKDAEVDYGGLGRIIEYQIEGGIDAILVLGTTGEPSTMTGDEKRGVVRFAFEKIAGRVPMVVGIGGNNPREVIDFGLWVREATGGRVSVMLTAPYYNRCTQAGAVRFFTEIADAVALPMMAYNVPGRTGVNIEPATFARITKNKHIWAVKEASGNMEQIAQVVRLCPDTSVFCGDDGLSLPSYAVGCAGTVSVASNVTPKQVREVWAAFNGGMVVNARRLYLEQLPFYKALFCEVNPIPVKYVMSTRGLCENELRLPLTSLGVENQRLLCYNADK